MPNREWPGLGPFWRPVGPYLEQGTSPYDEVPASTSLATETTDFSIAGWTRGTSLLAQGLVPLMLIAGPQFNPQPAQASVFPSARAAPVVAASAVESFFSIGQQSYVDPPSAIFESVVAGKTPKFNPAVLAGPQPDLTQRSTVFPSVRTPTAVSGILATVVDAAPEQIDLSIAGWTRGTSLLAQGDVPPFTGTVPQAEKRQYSAIWQSVRTPPAIIPGPLSTTVFAPQQADPSQLAARVFPSVRTPPTPVSGNLPQFTAASPQFNPSLPTALIWGPAYDAQGAGLSSEYRFGTHAVAIHNAENLKSQIWKSLVPPPSVTGILGQFFANVPQSENRQFSTIWAAQRAGQTTPIIPLQRGAPQFVDLTQQALLVPSAITQPVQGKVPPTVRGQPQDDPSGNPTQVWTSSTFSPSGPIPPVDVSVAAPIGHPVYVVDVKGKRKKPRAYQTANEQLKKILDTITVEVVRPDSKTTDEPILVKAGTGEQISGPKKDAPSRGTGPAVLPELAEPISPEEQEILDEDEEIIAMYLKGGFL